MLASAASVSEQLWERVRDQVGDERLDPDVNRERVSQVAGEVVGQYGREAAVGEATPLADANGMLNRLVRLVCDYGPLTAVIEDPSTEEILIEDDAVFVIANGRLRGLSEPTSTAINRHVINKLLQATSVSLDPESPLIQAQVLGGRVRLTAAGPPVVDEGGISATLRFYTERRVNLDFLVEGGSLTEAAANFLTLVMWALGRAVVSGPPAAGKTTALAGLLSAIRENHCVRVAEEYPELHLPTRYGRPYRCWQGNGGGEGAITLRDLVKFVLGMRADFIVIGEVRSAESYELIRAMRAGTGFACTLHANSAEEALEALVTTALAAGPNIDRRFLRDSFAAGVDVVVHVERDDPNLVADGDSYRREVTDIAVVVPQLLDDGRFSIQHMFQRKAGLGSPLVWTGLPVPEPLAHRLERVLPKGRTLRQVLGGQRGLR